MSEKKITLMNVSDFLSWKILTCLNRVTKTYVSPFSVLNAEAARYGWCTAEALVVGNASAEFGGNFLPGAVGVAARYVCIRMRAVPRPDCARTRMVAPGWVFYQPPSTNPDFPQDALNTRTL